MDEGINNKPRKVLNHLNNTLYILVEGSNAENKLVIFNLKTIFNFLKLILAFYHKIKKLRVF